MLPQGYHRGSFKQISCVTKTIPKNLFFVFLDGFYHTAKLHQRKSNYSHVHWTSSSDEYLVSKLGKNRTHWRFWFKWILKHQAIDFWPVTLAFDSHSVANMPKSAIYSMIDYDKTKPPTSFLHFFQQHSLQKLFMLLELSHRFRAPLPLYTNIPKSVIHPMTCMKLGLCQI